MFVTKVSLYNCPLVHKGITYHIIILLLQRVSTLTTHLFGREPTKEVDIDSLPNLLKQPRKIYPFLAPQ